MKSRGAGVPGGRPEGVAFGGGGEGVDAEVWHGHFSLGFRRKCAYAYAAPLLSACKGGVPIPLTAPAAASLSGTLRHRITDGMGTAGAAGTGFIAWWALT